MRIFILLSMIFCHIIADYNLQGWLANAKQKSWWEENAPKKLYRNDYLIAFINAFYVLEFYDKFTYSCIL